MVSKIQQHHGEDITKYLVDSGLNPDLLHMGFIATIRAIEKKNIEVILPCGESRRIWFQLELPQPRAEEAMVRWKKIFHRAIRRSAWVRFVGCGCENTGGMSTVWSLNEKSVILEQTNILDRNDIKLFESYCGAIGGWSRSAKWLQDGGFPIKTVGAGDWSADAVESWNVNSQESHTGGSVQAEIMNFAILEDWQKIVDSGATALSVSSSCRSFSYAGKQLGWDTDDGKHLALTIAYAALHGFARILFENVAPILQDKKYRDKLEMILRRFGYHIIFEVCINIQTFHPIDRTRAIFIVSSDCDHRMMSSLANSIRNVFDDIPTTLWQAHRWLDISGSIRDEVIIPEDELSQLSRYDRLPSFLKARTFCKNKDAVLETRRLVSNHPFRYCNGIVW